MFGHANKSKLEPALLRASTLVYFCDGEVGEAGVVTEPCTSINLWMSKKEG